MATLFYRNKRMFAVAILMILAAGLSAFVSVGRQEDPTISNLFATVVTPYPGADPARVETLVTEKIEDELKKIPEIREVESKSRTGISIVQVELAWRPSHRLNLGFQGERNWGKLPAGDVDIQLARARIDLFLTPNFQILSFLQYDNITKSLGLNTRLRFTYRSLLDIFLVYNRNWLDTQGRFLSELNQFFVKIQYSWRW